MPKPLHLNGILTLYDAFFQKDLSRRSDWNRISRLQFKTRGPD
jgi:hypothetical protein